MTTERWFKELIAATTAAHLPADALTAPRTPAARRKASEAAGAELDCLGIA